MGLAQKNSNKKKRHKLDKLLVVMPKRWDKKGKSPEKLQIVEVSTENKSKL